MGSRILYYLIIKPLSMLPYFVLYGVADFFFVLMFYVVGYRKKVVFKNLRNSFPEKSEEEIQRIARQFYRHFCDLVVESLKNFSISSEQATRRMKSLNPELLDPYFKEGRSVMLCGGHYGNWELWAVAGPQKMKHQVVAIYKTLSNAYFDQKMRSSRGKFGLDLVPTKKAGEFFRSNEGVTATVFGFDQSPANPQKSFWIHFLNQETACYFGPEKYAVELNRPVFFSLIRKIKRGYYTVEYQLVEAYPTATIEGDITRRINAILENVIREEPEYWLWTHKRWKHKRPADVPLAD